MKQEWTWNISSTLSWIFSGKYELITGPATSITIHFNKGKIFIADKNFVAKNTKNNTCKSLLWLKSLGQHLEGANNYENLMAMNMNGMTLDQSRKEAGITIAMNTKLETRVGFMLEGRTKARIMMSVRIAISWWWWWLVDGGDDDDDNWLIWWLIEDDWSRMIDWGWWLIEDDW